MWIDEITESLTTGSLQSLHDDVEHANLLLNRTHPLVRLRGDRRAQYIEYRDMLLAEIARRTTTTA